MLWFTTSAGFQDTIYDGTHWREGVELQNLTVSTGIGTQVWWGVPKEETTGTYQLILETTANGRTYSSEQFNVTKPVVVSTTSSKQATIGSATSARSPTVGLTTSTSSATTASSILVRTSDDPIPSPTASTKVESHQTSDGERSNPAVIAGIVLGSVAVTALLAIAILLFHRHQQKPQRTDTNTQLSKAQTPSMPVDLCSHLNSRPISYELSSTTGRTELSSGGRQVILTAN